MLWDYFGGDYGDGADDDAIDSIVFDGCNDITKVKKAWKCFSDFKKQEPTDYVRNY